MTAGRPRQFDVSQVLDKALEVFWRNGYEGTTLPELTEAMGISRPSLYAAFGNKESLFEKVVERYLEGPAAHLAKALLQPTAAKVVQAIFEAQACEGTEEERPRGCLIVQGALSCGAGAQTVQRFLSDRRLAFQDLLQKRFERAVAEGDLPPHAHPGILAKLVCAVNFGTAVLSADGVSVNDIAEVKRRFTASWRMLVLDESD